MDLDAQQQAALQQWLDELPEHVLKVADEYPCTEMYQFADSGKPCQIMQYDEESDGTVTFTVLTVDPAGRPYGVFGVKPSSLQRLP